MINAFRQIRLTNSLLTVTGTGILQVGVEQVVYRSQTGVFATTGSLNASGQFLQNLIQNSVVSLAGLSGTLNITGAGNVVTSTVGNLITVSGNTGAYANFATTGNLASTGSFLQSQISNVSGSTGNFVTVNDSRAIVFSNSLNVGTLSGTSLNMGGTANFSAGTATFANAPSFNAAGAPFTVLNSTVVTNLNADFLDGLNSTSFALASQTGTFITSGQTGIFITTNQQQTFITSIPTGIDIYFIQFPFNFTGTPKIQATIEVTGDTLYSVAVRARTISGYNALFSDIVQESGVSVHTSASIF